MASALIYVFYFILGTIIGSFLNVVILRYNTGFSPLIGHSACFSCGKRLHWYELIPIISFIALRGRCYGCGSRISIQYPLVEFLTALLFVAVVFHVGIFAPVSIVILHLIAISMLVIMVVYDMRHSIIPNGIVYGFAVVSFIIMLMTFSFDTILAHPYQLLFAGVFLALPFALISLISRGTWMGWGDAKLALGMGWFLGLAQGYSAVMYAFWIGAIVALLMRVIGKTIRGQKLTMKSEIPFAPFLIVGLFIVYIIGYSIISPDIVSALSLF
ncbi:MAG: prepilin peptidase [Candidatus Paceibacterota bacterium]|jgi:leader peptidase (prepilin peptidase)/N-methyltransferase